MAHQLDKLDLFLDAGRSLEVEVDTLADLAEFLGLWHGEDGFDLPATVAKSPVEISRHLAPMEIISRERGRSDPISHEIESGEISEISLELEAWEAGGAVVRFARRFKDALRRAGMETSYAHAVCKAFEEVVSNAQEHSGSSLRPVATYEVRDGWWSMSVTDVGRGIPDRLRENPRYAGLEDCDALARALQDGVSTSDEPGRGHGFSHVFNALANRSARLRFRTGSARATWTGTSPGATHVAVGPMRHRGGLHVLVRAALVERMLDPPLVCPR